MQTKFRTFLLIILFSITLHAQQTAPLGKLLSKGFDQLGEKEALILIYLKDKGAMSLSSVQPSSLVSGRSLARRAKVRASAALVDGQDLPLEQSYVHAIEPLVVEIRNQLKWFNAISARATKSQIESLRLLPFVKEIEFVGRWKMDEREKEQAESSRNPGQQSLLVDSLDYGGSYTQLNQINVPAVHNLGIFGQGITVGVFDNGFRLPNHEAFASMNIIATYDFVDHKVSVVPNNPSTSFGAHGINTLSTVGGYKPGQLIGPAFKADFILARTENDSSETPVEEDNWAKAIEWADSIGIDVASTSLGYLGYDAPYPGWTWQDMDGNTTLITKAADRAVGLGIVVVNSAGNEGYSDVHNTLIGPADGDSVITAGAVTSSGSRSSFSSVGPTTDVPPRIKPDIMAMGSSVRVASSSNPTGYASVNGTSFSCPLSAGVAALILCANPSLTPMQVRDAMRQTANNSGSPNNSYGWGILNTLNAIQYFGISSRISGKVYFDKNANGAYSGTDSLISGITVLLSGAVTDTLLTDATGSYITDSLPYGNYTVTVNIPPSHKILSPVSGSYSITIDSAHPVASQKDFGIVQRASIAGIVYEDNNGNGSLDAGEPGLNNWEVRLTSDTTLTVFTDSAGGYSFSNLDAGNYALSESLMTDWQKTQPVSFYSMTLSYNQSLQVRNFGNFRYGSIQGTVFNDLDNNGEMDSTDTPLSNWVIKLNGTTSALTDSAGNYLFTNVGAGTYAVTESLETGFLQTYPPGGQHYTIVMRSGLDTSALDFGNHVAPVIHYPVSADWNLLSMPQQISNHELDSVYPNAVTSIFIFNNGYAGLDTVPDHLGYWLKFASSGVVSIIGDGKTSDSIEVTKGWNIIGSLGSPIAVTNIVSEPDSLLPGTFFGFDGAYSVADSLYPHKGYWFKAKENGILYLSNEVIAKQKSGMRKK